MKASNIKTATSRGHVRRVQQTGGGDNAKPRYINPNDDYEEFLNKLRIDFNAKFDNPKPSPSFNLDGYEELIVLGAGSYGKVKLVKKTRTGQYYAVKIMLKSAIVRMKKVHHVLSEKRVIAAVQFPALVNLEFSSKDNDYLYLGLPVISGGELYTYHRRVKKFCEKQARFYAMQIFLGFEYLHHLNVLYRDLKLENILINTDGYIKLTDFGFAKKVEDRTFTLCGTPEYLPPEVIQTVPYGTSADWWCFGVFLYEMVAGHTPFYDGGHDVLVMYSRICDGDYRIPGYFSEPFKDLINGLLQIDVTKRLGCQIAGCSDIKKHAWFREIDWFAMLNQEVQAPYIPTIENLADTSNFVTETSRPGVKSEVNRHFEVFRDF